MTGRFSASGAVRKCWSISWPPVEQLVEVVHADRCTRSTGRSRSTASSGRRPSPRTRTCSAVSMPKRGHFLRVRRQRDEVLRDRVVAGAELLEQPRARGLRVGQRLLRRERLARDDEQRALGVDALERLGDVRAVDVRHEVRSRMPRLPVRAQRLGDHHRAEVGAADADVDDVGDRLAGVALPRAAAHAVGELAHLREHAR